MSMDFWDRLDKEIEAKSNRKTVTENAHIADNAVHYWIKRKTYPPADVIVSVAKTLKMSVEELVTGENSSASFASIIERRSDLRAIVEKLAVLDDTQLRKALRMVDACFADETTAPPTQKAAGE